MGIIVTWSCCTGWLFAFDQENLELSLNMLLLSALGLYFALGISYKVVYENEARLENSSKGGRLSKTFNFSKVICSWSEIMHVSNVSASVSIDYALMLYR